MRDSISALYYNKIIADKVINILHGPNYDSNQGSKANLTTSNPINLSSTSLTYSARFYILSMIPFVQLAGFQQFDYLDSLYDIYVLSYKLSN